MMLIKKKKKVRHWYIVKYKLKHDDTIQYSINDLVRMYKWKDTFKKTV